MERALGTVVLSGMDKLQYLPAPVGIITCWIRRQCPVLRRKMVVLCCGHTVDWVLLAFVERLLLLT